MFYLYEIFLKLFNNLNVNGNESFIIFYRVIILEICIPVIANIYIQI